jgi:hypothetical protein
MRVMVGVTPNPGAGCRAACQQDCRGLEFLRADVAELVDAHGSGPCAFRGVEVQVLSSASLRGGPPAPSGRSGSGAEDGEDVVRVRLGLDLPHHLRELSVGIDHECRALDAHVRLAVSRLLDPDAVRLCGGMVGIGEQREGKVEFLLEPDV